MFDVKGWKENCLWVYQWHIMYILQILISQNNSKHGFRLTSSKHVFTSVAETLLISLIDHFILIVRKEREEKEYTACQREKEGKCNIKKVRKERNKVIMLSPDAYCLLQWNEKKEGMQKD